MRSGESRDGRCLPAARTLPRCSPPPPPSPRLAIPLTSSLATRPSRTRSRASTHLQAVLIQPLPTGISYIPTHSFLPLRCSQELVVLVIPPSQRSSTRKQMKGMGPTMEMAPAPPTGKAASHMSMMHMTFFWGDRAVVLFPGWPGARGTGAYLLCLLFVLALAALTEALAAASRCLARRGAAGGAGGRVPASSAALLTAAHAARMGTAYLVMLAVMSFNGGVLLAAVAGHALGFLLARSRVGGGAGGGGGGASGHGIGGVGVHHPPDGSKA